jgi:hypothetical protein
MARVLHGSAATTAAVRGADTAWSSELDGFGEAPRDQSKDPSPNGNGGLRGLVSG